MPSGIGTIPKPVRKDRTGALRVGNSRVSLDSVVYAFNRGQHAIDIQREFDTLSLAEVHGAISYYLHNKAEVDALLAKNKAEFERLRELNLERFPSRVTKKELLARMKKTDRDQAK